MTNKVIAITSKNIRENIEFLKDYCALLKNIFVHDPELKQIQIKRLIESASIFSLNDDDFYQKISSKIVTYLLKYKNIYESIPYLAQLIIIRLGDIPVISHMVENENIEDYFSFFNENDYNILYIKFPEIASAKNKNQIEINGKKIMMTNFQKKVYDKLNSNADLAFSAPPSAGKSFIIHNYIIKQIKTHDEYCTVYVAPTKALLAEIQDRLSILFNASKKDTETLLITNSVNDHNINYVNNYKKKILVLTQERLTMLIYNYANFKIDLLIIDEVQKINDAKRGVILLDAIKETILVNKNMQKIFISPNTKNLNSFKKMFDIKNDMDTFMTKNSPVNQNILFVNLHDKKIHLSLLVNELSLSLDLFTKITKENIPSKIYQRKALVVNELLHDLDHTLIYCNSGNECRHLAKSINISNIDNANNIEDYLKFLKIHIHEDYDLIDQLQKNIGYHYGKMPQFVRHIVKKLFDDGVIKFLCCTSTLLEGVNLPAKNIVIHQPHLGIKKIDRLSFLNLVGRAGRLQKDYYGNIYCINTKKNDLYDMFDEEYEDVTNALEETLSNHSTDLLSHLNKYDKDAKDGIKTTASSLIFQQLFDSNSKFLYELKKRGIISDASLFKLKSKLEEISDEIIQLDRQTIRKNRMVDARLQYELYDYFKKSKLILPPDPKDQNFKSQLKEIFHTISKILMCIDNNKYKYFSSIANQWIGHVPYNIMLKFKIKYSFQNPFKPVVIESSKNPDNIVLKKEAINVIIDSFDEELETMIKFEYTKNLQCYCDIIGLVMKENGDERTFCQELPEYLETGAHDQRILFLLNLGISRNTAIHLYERINNVSNIDECVNWLKLNMKSMEDELDNIHYEEIKMRLEILQ